MKIQFTQRLPLGSEVHLGKERGCFRGIDLIHGPYFTGFSGHFMIQKPNRSLNSHAPDSCNPVISIYRRDNTIDLGTPLKSRLVHRLILVHTTVFPEKRYFFETSTTEVAIQTNLLSDLYASIGTGCSRTGWYTTFFKLPFIFIIRIGFLLASLGGSRRVCYVRKKEKLEFSFHSFGYHDGCLKH